MTAAANGLQIPQKRQKGAIKMEYRMQPTILDASLSTKKDSKIQNFPLLEPIF